MFQISAWALMPWLAKSIVVFLDHQSCHGQFLCSDFPTRECCKLVKPRNKFAIWDDFYHPFMVKLCNIGDGWQIIWFTTLETHPNFGHEISVHHRVSGNSAMIDLMHWQVNKKIGTSALFFDMSNSLPSNIPTCLVFMAWVVKRCFDNSAKKSERQSTRKNWCVRASFQKLKVKWVRTAFFLSSPAITTPQEDFLMVERIPLVVPSFQR